MIRIIITPQNTDLHLSIPKDYVGKKLEVSYLPIEELLEDNSGKKTSMAQFWGVISNQTAEDLHKNTTENRNQWDSNI